MRPVLYLILSLKGLQNCKRRPLFHCKICVNCHITGLCKEPKIGSKFKYWSILSIWYDIPIYGFRSADICTNRSSFVFNALLIIRLVVIHYNYVTDVLVIISTHLTTLIISRSLNVLVQWIRPLLYDFQRRTVYGACKLDLIILIMCLYLYFSCFHIRYTKNLEFCDC